MGVKKKRVQFDIRGNDVSKFTKHVSDRGEPETVVMRDIVRLYYENVNTKYNE